MAAIDKMQEFYTAGNRFGFLATCYRPEDLPDEVNGALDVISEYVSSNKDFLEKCEIASDYFETHEKRRRKMELAEVLSMIVKESVC